MYGVGDQRVASQQRRSSRGELRWLTRRRRIVQRVAEAFRRSPVEVTDGEHASTMQVDEGVGSVGQQAAGNGQGGAVGSSQSSRTQVPSWM